MNSAKVTEAVKEALNKALETLKKLPGALGKVTGGLPEIITNLSDRLLGHFPEKNRKPILYAMGGLTLLLIILLFAAIADHSGSTKKIKSESIAEGPFIPSEDLFIPAEPDFAPDYIPAREPRQSWSAEDIHSYWRIPAEDYPWREEIKLAVDMLLESVP